MESDPDTRHSWNNASAVRLNFHEELEVEGNGESWVVDKDEVCPRKRPGSHEPTGVGVTPRLGHAEDCNCSESEEWTESSSSSSEYSEDSGAEEPAVKKLRTDSKSDNENPEAPSAHQLSDTSPSVTGAIPNPKALSPRSFNRQLLKSVRYDDYSDLSSISSLTSDEFNDILTSVPRRVANPRPRPVPQVEYEVSPFSPINDNPIEDSNSSSSLEDDEDEEVELQVQALIKNSSDSDSEFESFAKKDGAENFADDDEESDLDDGTNRSSRSSGLSSDSEISEKDMWFCTQCNVKTNKPYLRYCLRCFRIRKNWLPTRPKSKKRKLRQRQQVKQAKRDLQHHAGSLDDSSEDIEPASTPEAKNSFNQSMSIASSQESNMDLKLSDKLQSILDAPPLLVQKTALPPIPVEPGVETCSICMVRDKNAGFVHGKTAHMYSCYTCADKILKKSGKCPICRKKILRVVKIISV